MISSAREFIRLRTSSRPDDQERATKDSASDAVWVEVIEQYPEMRSWVAHNKTVSVAVLTMLSTVRDVSVRRAVARKRKLPHELLETLAADADEGVRLAVASNRSTPASVLRKLLRDPWRRVAEVAHERLLEREKDS